MQTLCANWLGCIHVSLENDSIQKLSHHACATILTFHCSKCRASTACHVFTLASFSHHNQSGWQQLHCPPNQVRANGIFLPVNTSMNAVSTKLDSSDLTLLINDLELSQAPHNSGFSQSVPNALLLHNTEQVSAQQLSLDCSIFSLTNS